jgi:HEAT repeat protein
MHENRTMYRRLWFSLLVISLAPGAGLAWGAESPEVNRDEALLRSLGVPTDGSGLLAFFRTRSQERVKPERVAALIEQLGDRSPIVAQRAVGELAAIGPAAIPALRQAVKDPDLHQTALLAGRCLHSLEEHPGELPAAAARLLSQRRPPGTTEALLTFLPLAEDEGVVEEIRLALVTVAYADDKPDPALLQALQDQAPIRRGLAIDSLCQNGIPPSLMGRFPLRKLLQDPQPSVRLRAGLALVRGHDAKAVSTLITLLTELPLDLARQAEDYLAELAGDNAPKALLGTDAATRKKCRDAWAAWWQSTEDPGHLLDDIRKRTPSVDLRRKGEVLIRQLGDNNFAVREKAEAQVRAMGAPALPLLRKAVKDPDLEVSRRARTCLADLERDKNLPLPQATPRLIALRKPEGAAEALLEFTPFADEETTQGDVQIALNAVSFRDGKPEPDVVRALSDALGARRAAAAEALCLGGDREHLPAIRKMLGDKDPAVRLKAALALAGAREREAVTTLINLIGELPTAQSAPAEEYLYRVAQDQAPTDLPPGDNGDNRKKRKAAWEKWWKANGDRVALVDRYPPNAVERYHGYILLVMPQNGVVTELGADRKPRWELKGLRWPRDAVVLGPDRILVAEYNGNCVTERNLRGEILWQKQLPGSYPVAVQRLRNGHTFITCQNKLVEIDRGGREVLTIDRPQNDTVMARKMRDGQIILVSQNSVCVRLDATGKELKQFQVQMAWHNGIDILANGHVIIPAIWMNRVIEYDQEGKSVWEVNSMQPMAACRLPSGNTLIGNQMWPSKVLELDATGKQVSEISSSNHVYRIRTR